MKKIYLAGALGFSELGNISSQFLKNKLNYQFSLVDPFEESSEDGKKIIEIQTSNKSLIDIKKELKSINYNIGKKNETLIRESDIVLANLDGSDVDSGTAAEIGFAYAIGKKIIGYRGDFRLSADNLGSIVNLQVEYFILKSGGIITKSIEELLDTINSEIKKI